MFGLLGKPYTDTVNIGFPEVGFKEIFMEFSINIFKMVIITSLVVMVKAVTSFTVMY